MARTLHGITWTDPLAWMEPMQGARWDALVSAAQAKWEAATEPHKDDIALVAAEISAAFEVPHAMVLRASIGHGAAGEVEISYGGTDNLSWRFTQGPVHKGAADLVARRGGLAWTLEEVGEGAEIYSACMWQRGHQKPLWTYKGPNGLAPQIALVGGRCYLLEAKKTLVYSRLISLDATTGKDRQVHYEETDFRYNLELIRGNAGHAWLRRQSGAAQDAALITRKNIRWLQPPSRESRRYVFGSLAGEYLVWTAAGWNASPAAAAVYPSWEGATPEILDTRRGFLVTKSRGERTLWRIRRGRPPVKLWRAVGQIMIDPWDSAWVRFTQPGQEAVWWNSAAAAAPPRPVKAAATSQAKSRDGTQIPFYTVSRIPKPVGLLVICYGAYDLPTGLMTALWEPLLKRGWAITFGMLRGGGDDTPQWADAGRLYGRIKTLEDAEAVVRAARAATGVVASRTVLHGRSAGGLWVGGLVAKFPDGDLAGGAYMGVPFLDVLRTTSNPALPLTEIETDEFGRPDLLLTDMMSAVEWSPMELIPEKGVKGVWQIVRTGLNDSEVLAYESAKWIARSGAGADAYLVVEGGQGHFVRGDLGYVQQAEDICMILELSGRK